MSKTYELIYLIQLVIDIILATLFLFLTIFGGGCAWGGCSEFTMSSPLVFGAVITILALVKFIRPWLKIFLEILLLLAVITVFFVFPDSSVLAGIIFTGTFLWFLYTSSRYWMLREAAPFKTNGSDRNGSNAPMQ